MKRALALLLCAAILSGVFVFSVAAQEENTLPFNGQNVSFTAEGDLSQHRQFYWIGKDFVLTLKEANAVFNQFVITYSATQPLRCAVTYADGQGTQAAEEFFLEAGENLTFAQLIDGFLDGKTQAAIVSFRFSTITDTESVLAVHSVDTRLREQLGENVTYLENDRYKVGVDLAWGGGISYLEDKLDQDASISNLLNRHDTGRLVQQSYYGSNSAPYTPGRYNNSTWRYNPVQGGDQYNNASKLVDFYVTDTEIYVKARPLDWALKNTPTLSYMENTYILQEDGLEVDNGFVDFSDYDHPIRDQELPAFYTISYLGNFYFYNGNQPWTGDALSVERNLPFWSPQTSTTRKTYQAGNTETWVAWTDNADWGVGLYVPNVTYMLAGRHQYDGSKSASASSTNYVAPLRHMMIRLGERIEYSYYITTGALTDIRAKFTEIKDTFPNNASLDQGEPYTNITFETLFGQRRFTHLNDAKVTFADGLAALTATNMKQRDPYARLDLTGCGSTLKAENYPYVVFTYMAPETNSGVNYGHLFYGAGTLTNPDGNAVERFSVSNDGQWHSAIVDLSGKTNWKGKPNFLRLDFFGTGVEGDTMYLKSVQLAPTMEAAQLLAEQALEQKHSLCHVAATDAACLVDGNVEYWYCMDCGKYYLDAAATTEVTQADTILVGPDHVYGDWKFDAEGHWKECFCSDKTEKQGHTGTLINVVPPTAEEDGYTGDLVCEICEYVLEEGQPVVSIQRTAAEVEALIAAADTAEAVAEARAAYEALSEEAKALVTNLPVLEAAELYWATVNGEVILTLTGPAEINAFDETVTYTLSAENMTNLATVILEMEISADTLSQPVVEGCDGWTVVGQAYEDGKLYIAVANMAGVTGSGDLLTVTLKPTNEPGEASLALTDADLSAYLGEGETFVPANTENASITTTVRFSIYDVNRDGIVDQLDMTRAQRYFGSYHKDADVNADNVVDIEDLILILNNYHTDFMA